MNTRREYMLMVRASQQKKYVDIPTYIYIHKNMFDKGLVSKKHPQSDGLNAMLTNIVMDIQGVEIEAYKHDIEVSTQKVYTMYVEHLSASIPIKEFTKKVLEFSPRRKPCTKKKFMDVVNRVTQFSPNITLEDIDVQWLHRFETFCYKSGNSESTIYSNFKILRTLFNEAIRRDLLKPWQTPFKNFPIPEVKSRNDVLRLPELEQLQKAKLPRHTLDVARDLFLLSAYTGLRWSDLKRLRSYHIRKIGDVTWLEMETQKTGQFIQVPISLMFYGNAMKIIEKYRTIELLTMAYDHNGSINRLLKEVFAITGIGGTQHITCHTARRSCITGLADFGVNVYTIQRIVGHRRITTTQKYIVLSTAAIEQDIRKAFAKKIIA